MKRLNAKRSHIPLDVLRDILLLLPAESLFRFRIVCKEWRCLIDDPSFIRSHTLTHQHSSTTLCITTAASTRTSFLYLSLDSLEYTDGYQIIDVTRVKGMMAPSLPMSSCNGLKLLSRYDSRGLIQEIWNPLTREFHKLPPPDGLVRSSAFVSSGFGYDYSADEYKVVRIDSNLFSGVLETRVYSLKLDSWKMSKECPYGIDLYRQREEMSKECPYGIDLYRQREGVFLNGSLHWLLRGGKIIAFDLKTEDFCKLPKLRAARRFGDGRLDALSGSLVVSWYSSDSCYEGWLMEDNGSWMKLFSFEDIDMNEGKGRIVRPIAYLKSKRQVILQDYSHISKEVVFDWLDIEKNTWKKFTIQGLKKHITCHVCPGSLFRLDQTLHLKRTGDARLKCYVAVTGGGSPVVQ